MIRTCCAILLSALFLASCSSFGGKPKYTPPRSQNSFKVGNPYQISGKWYTPRESYSYDETGIASWYGDQFHGKRTANGEIFDKNALTAAHPTLQMPSLVRVTNLETGRSAVLRVNDRGPFSKSRLIDVSHSAARVLGFEGQGTARVRIQVLDRESRILAEAARQGHPPNVQMAMAFGPSSVKVDEDTIRVASADSSTSIHTRVEESEIPPPPKTVTKADIEDLNKHLFRKYPVSPTAIYVQVGAFSNINNAEALKQKLEPIGQTRIFQTTVNGQPFNRVRVGPVQQVDKADALLRRVMAAGYPGARIVVD